MTDTKVVRPAIKIGYRVGALTLTIDVLICGMTDSKTTKGRG